MHSMTMNKSHAFTSSPWEVLSIPVNGYHRFGNPFSIFPFPLSISSPLTLQILLPDHFPHPLLIYLTLHPGYDIQIGEGTGLETVFFEVLDGV